MSTILKHDHINNSDSEDDEDYVPPDKPNLESDQSDAQDENGALETGSEAIEVQETTKRKREALWSSFQASVAGPSKPRQEDVATQRLVKIEPMNTTEYMQASFAETPSTSSNPATPPALPNADKHAPRRPGPRKSKTSLAPVPGSSKPKKLTTLDKSAMDWKSHIQTQQEAGASIRDELEANRRAGGYLEKVEFLKRVEERKEDNLESLKSNKRRKI